MHRSVDVAAQRRRAARLDARRTRRSARTRCRRGLPVGVAMVAEDVRHLQRGRDGACFRLASRCQIQPVERADGGADRVVATCDSAPWSTAADGRAAPGSCANRCRPRAGGWQSCGAGYARSRACRASPSPSVLAGPVRALADRCCRLGFAAGKQPVAVGVPANRRATCSSSCADSMTWRSLPPLPVLTRISMRWLSMSPGRSATTSETRSPAA